MRTNLAANTTNELVCPSCGNFVDELNNITGWCSTCSIGTTKQSSRYIKTNKHFCKFCKQETAYVCRKHKCKLEKFLERNADALEYYILKGCTLNESIDLCREYNRPNCIVCGISIKCAKPNALFCQTNAECRKVRRRYIYYYYEKHMSKAEALGRIISAL